MSPHNCSGNSQNVKSFSCKQKLCACTIVVNTSGKNDAKTAVAVKSLTVTDPQIFISVSYYTEFSFQLWLQLQKPLVKVFSYR